MKAKYFVGLIIGAAAFAAMDISPPEAKITVRVIDEAAQPMPGVDVRITFEMPKYQPGVWGSANMLTKKGISDAAGLFSVEAKSGNYVGYEAQAPGHYNSTGNPVEFLRSDSGRWQPWNPTMELVLKKIIKPIPMYARRLEQEVPVLDEAVGFDLLKADWIPPYGRGQSSDILFKLTKRVESFHNFGAELLVNFPKNGDGISEMPDARSGSELRSAHTAPEEGYAPSLSLLQGNSKERGLYGMGGDKTGYFFRVRTVVDEHGRVVSCMYGKIYGRIEYFPVSYKAAKVRFTYYLNPSVNNRNVEFDPKRNLFTGLKSDEQVTAP
jgi:hypothetical protein